MQRRSPCACALFALFALSACEFTTPGTRAGTGGYCPEGEDCSDYTPQGLYFKGPTFSDCLLFCDSGIKKTAVGGTQGVTAYEDEWADFAFDRPFSAAILGESYAVEEVSPPDVTVRAEAPDWSILRILDPTSGELFDRVSMNAASLDYVLLEPANAMELGLIDELTPWAIYTEHASLVVALHDEHGGRLVDESMAVSLSSSSPGALARDRWDRVSLSGLEPGPVTLSVTAGEWAEREVEVDAVDAVDSIERITDLWDDPSEPLPVGRSASYCFRGLSEGVPVAGLDWAFTSTDAEIEPSVFGNCVSLVAEEVGTVALTATAAGAELTVTISVVETEQARATAAPGFDSFAGRSAVPGERAATR